MHQSTALQKVHRNSRLQTTLTYACKILVVTHPWSVDHRSGDSGQYAVGQPLTIHQENSLKRRGILTGQPVQSSEAIHNVTSLMRRGEFIARLAQQPETQAAARGKSLPK